MDRKVRYSTVRYGTWTVIDWYQMDIIDWNHEQMMTNKFDVRRRHQSMQKWRHVTTVGNNSSKQQQQHQVVNVPATDDRTPRKY